MPDTPAPADPRLVARAAEETGLPAARVAAVIALLDERNTVPFIARYRKEATGGLDEVQIRAVEEQVGALRELDARRETVLRTIAELGKLDDALRDRILDCRTRAELEDLYLPYRPKRRTRAAMARERGLEPLAELVLAQPAEGDPETAARPYVDAERGVADTAAALAGARDIIAERVAEDGEVRTRVRTSPSSATRSAMMSRAPARAAAVSATPRSAST